VPVRLPLLSDYNVAVQNPPLAFADPDLKNSTPALTKIGLPHGVTGNFAVTFHLIAGHNNWAVRCFYKNLPHDLRRRYETINRFLAKNKNDLFVDAQYVEQGICVRGSWYPIVKMPWVKGQQLDNYISQNISNKTAVSWLPEVFSRAVSELEDMKVGHGDLQHGNIMVDTSRRKLVLVDYDGMYVPGLDGLRSIEVGHPNYQHPARESDTGYFDPTIDRFSTLVIYVALTALSTNPNLWDDYSGAESLLFTKKDFVDPYSSVLFNDLCEIEGLTPLVENLQEICEGELRAVPRLSDFRTQPYLPKIRETGPAATVGKIVEISHKLMTPQAVPHVDLTLLKGGREHVVLVWPPAMKMFSDSSAYLGKRVRIRGQLSKSRLEFSDASQLEILDEIPTRPVKFCHIDGRRLRSGANYCLACGTATVNKMGLPKSANFCYSCGYKARPRGRFCLDCGTRYVI
jgi:serine/threonine protein kinase